MKKLPIISICLVAINIIVYLICLFDGGRLYSEGCLGVYPVIVEGQYGRILSAMFLHANTEHLFSNMIIVLFLGTMIEREVGGVWYGMAYLLSGIGGNLVSLWWKVVSLNYAVSIGASGAVFGLDGLLIAMLLFRRNRLVQVTPIRMIGMVLFSLYCGFRSESIDNAAHLGGLVTGFLTGCVLCIIYRKGKVK